MANKIKKPAGTSNFPIQQPSNIHRDPLKLTAAETEQELAKAIAAEDYPRMLVLVDAAPSWMKKQPEFMLVRATALMSQGDDEESLRLLHEIERKAPRFMAVYLPLATVYRERGWLAHAIKYAKRAISNHNLIDESRLILEQISEEGTELIQRRAEELGLSLENMQRALLFNERAEMAMDENRLSEVDYFTREAIRMAPNWNPPHNNQALAFYYSGRISEALAVSEAVLARNPEDTFALNSLVTFYIGLDQPQKAREYANQLMQLSKKSSATIRDIEHAISALSIVEDTTALWEIAIRYLEAPSDTLLNRSWQSLAVAASRSGKVKDAKKLIKKVSDEELSPMGKRLRDELDAITNEQKPHLAWLPPEYPGIDLFLHPKVIAEWEALQENFSDPITPSQKRKIDGFFQKYPFMFVLMKRLLWDEASHQAGLETLLQMETPEADAEILRFALSQVGSRDARMNALMMLAHTDRYSGPKVIKLWYEDLEEWREVELSTQRIGEIESNIQPKTLILVEKARKSKNPQESIALLRKAVELEPTSPIAVFNLGVILALNGAVEEGEALIYHSVEVDPSYAFGHASIALSEADHSREQEAIKHLDIVTRTEVITPETAVIANLAWAVLAINKQDFKTARRWLDSARQINPENARIQYYEEVLKNAESVGEKFGFLMEYQRQSAQRAHQKLLKTQLTVEMDVRACLATNTKDMLTGTARFLQSSAAGKKGELVDRLAEILLDEEYLQQSVKSLEEKEREALRWMLETDGIRPWKEFVRIYGDDADESTAWNYWDPKSIPGRLRMSGLFYSGTLEGQHAAFIPADVRQPLRKLLD